MVLGFLGLGQVGLGHLQIPTSPLFGSRDLRVAGQNHLGDQGLGLGPGIGFSVVGFRVMP